VGSGRDSPDAANMIGNLKHWLEDEKEIRELGSILPCINQCDISESNQPKKFKLIYR
jgi:ArsR family transcriptional regulator, arsenate/arsenite/antimonite-responsive transcriptional repressor